MRQREDIVRKVLFEAVVGRFMIFGRCVLLGLVGGSLLRCSVSDVPEGQGCLSSHTYLKQRHGRAAYVPTLCKRMHGYRYIISPSHARYLACLSPMGKAAALQQALFYYPLGRQSNAYKAESFPS